MSEIRKVPAKRGRKPGPQPALQGNDLATKHGLFANTFRPGSEAERVYQAAQATTDPSKLARDAAFMLLARISEAYSVDPELESAHGAVAEALRRAVAEGYLSREAAQRALKRVFQPSLESLAKALGPLRSLLARMDVADPESAASPTGVIVINAKSEDWNPPQIPAPPES